MHGETHARIPCMIVDKRPNAFIAPPARPTSSSGIIAGIGNAAPVRIRILIRRIHSKHHRTPISIMLHPAAPPSTLAAAPTFARPCQHTRHQEFVDLVRPPFESRLADILLLQHAVPCPQIHIILARRPHQINRWPVSLPLRRARGRSASINRCGSPRQRALRHAAALPATTPSSTRTGRRCRRRRRVTLRKERRVILRAVDTPTRNVDGKRDRHPCGTSALMRLIDHKRVNEAY